MNHAKASPWLAVFALLVCISAHATTYVYPAKCVGSYSKQGPNSEDLRQKKGDPISCDTVLVSFLDNGRVLIQFSNKRSNITPLGFSGGGFDFEMNPNLATVHVDRMDLPHSSNPSNAESLSGVEGYCFVGGKINLRSLSEISCASKIELGAQRLVFHVDAQIKGLGQAVPGL